MDILDKLKSLQKDRGEDSAPFADHLEYMKWVDEVSPLLSFDKDLKSKFDKRALSADVSSKIGSPKDSTGSKNATVGMLNQAITMLEIQPIHNSTAEPSSNKAGNPIDVEKISLHKIAERVIGALLIAGCLWAIAHYFGLEL